MTKAKQRIQDAIDWYKEQDIDVNEGNFHHEQTILTALQHLADVADGGWQPIGTAPKDNQVVLCVWPNGDYYQISKYLINEGTDSGDFWFEASRGNHLVNKTGFTHWMPLPAAPLSKAEQMLKEMNDENTE